MLKLELDTLEGVDEAVSGLYEKKGDKYRLKVEGVEDVSGLKAQVAKLLDAKKAAQKQAREEAEAREAAAAEAAAKAGDVDALTKSWEAKFAKREAELAESIRARDAQLVDLTVGATATKLAGDLAVPGSADVLLPHIKNRLAYQDGRVVVLDGEGKPSAATVDELAKEIGNDKRFAPLIVASMATGGGAAGSKGRAQESNPKADFGGDKDSRLAAAQALLDKHSA